MPDVFRGAFQGVRGSSRALCEVLVTQPRLVLHVTGPGSVRVRRPGYRSAEWRFGPPGYCN